MPDFGRLPQILGTLAIAAAGAAVAAVLDLPAAWLSGAMIAVTVASLVGLNTRLPARLFDAVMMLIGIVLGAGVTPDLVSRMSTWPLSLAGLLISVSVPSRTRSSKVWGGPCQKRPDSTTLISRITRTLFTLGTCGLYFSIDFFH